MKERIKDIIGNDFLFKNKLIKSRYPFNAKRVGLYFSSYLCESCKIMSPLIKTIFQDANKNSKNMEIVQISLDKTKSDFDKSTHDANWLIIPFNDKRIPKLIRICNVKLIPKLVILREDGSEITQNGIEDIFNLQHYSLLRWFGKPI